MSAPHPYAPDRPKLLPAFLRRNGVGDHLDALKGELELNQSIVADLTDQAGVDAAAPPPEKMSRVEMIARLLVVLPLNDAVDMAEDILKNAADEKKPDKIWLAMLLNEWGRSVVKGEETAS